MQKNIGRKGFTLIEIMIVCMILAVLVGIAIPNFLSARSTSRQKTCIASLKRIDAAKEQWALDNKKNTGDTPAWSDLVPLYIKSQPSCGSGGTYTISAVGTNPSCSFAGHVLP